MNKAEKKQLHIHLCELMVQVERDKNIQPVLKLIYSLPSRAQVQLDIVNWIHAFSPFTLTKLPNGKYRAKISNSKIFKLKDAQNKPFWQETSSMTSRTPSKKDVQSLSKKEILNSLKDFFALPQDKTLTSLITQLEQYKNYGMTVAGVDRKNKSKVPYVSTV